MPLSEIADQISYVSQDNYLFNRSIRENIRMGRPVSYTHLGQVKKISKVHRRTVKEVAGQSIFLCPDIAVWERYILSVRSVR